MKYLQHPLTALLVIILMMSAVAHIERIDCNGCDWEISDE